MPGDFNRRQVLSWLGSAGVAALLPVVSPAPALAGGKAPWLKISVVQWSFQREFYAGRMQTMDFPAFVKNRLGLDAVDYISDFMQEMLANKALLKELKSRSDDAGIDNVMVMCHKVGHVGHVNRLERNRVIEAHYKWIEAAHQLGCQSLRVNARSAGPREQQVDLVVNSLSKLCEFAKGAKMNIIVENLWGSDYSHKADFIAEIMEGVGMDNCGTLPDFNNFRYDDPYESVAKLMPWAKSVSAKSLDFDPFGAEKYIDYNRMLKIVYSSGFKGYAGIEWEGCKKTNVEGVLLTKALLERERAAAVS